MGVLNYWPRNYKPIGIPVIFNLLIRAVNNSAGQEAISNQNLLLLVLSIRYDIGELREMLTGWCGNKN